MDNVKEMGEAPLGPLLLKFSLPAIAVMVVNGLGHNLGVWLTGRYFGGFAGGFTGIGLMAIGGPLVYYLRRACPGRSTRPCDLPPQNG